MYRIILLDDEALIREGVSENVKWEQYGYEFIGSFENGREAYSFIEHNPVDVVITDICMPYMDGIELSEKLRSQYPDIKIIILSGYDNFEYAKKALHYGVKDYLLKPITAQELGEVLTRLRNELDRECADRRKAAQMKATYYKGQMLLYSTAIRNLITGTKREHESRKELEELNINLDAEAYRVAVLELPLYAHTERLEEKAKGESALMTFALHNIASELVGERSLGVACQGKPGEVYILFATEAAAEAMEEIRAVLQTIIHQMNTMMKLEVNIGVGEQSETMKDIYVSYEEAREALSYCDASAANQIVEIEEIRRGNEREGKKYALMAMDYIEKNYADCDLRLSSVCSFLNISASRFSTIFKAELGNTFMDVLIGIRMKKAKKLLEYTDLKNYEIAERVGFNDPHYFSIAFKKMTGKSPTEYAKEMRRKDGQE